MSSGRYLAASEWVTSELKRMFPEIVLERSTDYSVECFKDDLKRTEIIEPRIGGIRSDDVVLLYKLGYPAIPDRLKAYNDYCALNVDAQRNIVKGLLEAGRTNMVVWKEAMFLVDAMTEMYYRGSEHPHYRELHFELHHMRRKKVGRPPDYKKEQRNLIIVGQIREVHLMFDIPVYHDGCWDKVCSCSIVADACSTHFPGENISARVARDIYYLPKRRVKVSQHSSA